MAYDHLPQGGSGKMQHKYTGVKIISMHMLYLCPLLQLLYLLYTFIVQVCVCLVLYMQMQKWPLLKFSIWNIQAHWCWLQEKGIKKN